METYQKTVKEMKKLPYDDELLNNLQGLDPSKQAEETVRSKCMTLAKQFPEVVSTKDHSKLDTELRHYDTFEVLKDINRTDVVKYWVEVGKLNDTLNRTFPLLYLLVKALLIILHSNTESEQLFPD